MSSNIVHQQPAGTMVLEGNVRIDIKPPQGGQRLGQPRSVTVKAETVLVTRLENGGVTLEFENGSIEEH
jgi:hypothetical protein